MSGAPDPKSRTLARGERRYRRKVASPKQWQAIQAAKGGYCRIGDGVCRGPYELHHVVPRDLGGDDVADNIVALCGNCHRCVTQRLAPALKLLAGLLSDAEYAYVVGKLGEGALERLFGVSAR